MLEFQLFRIKVFPSQQLTIFESPKSRSEILELAINSLPSAELRKGHIWHIGNIVRIDEAGLYFRVGRISKSTIEIYQDGNFLDTEFETAPYTHVFSDIKLEIFAIAKKGRLSPKTLGIANKLNSLLNESKIAKNINVKFEISDLVDPEDFITHLKKAYSISKFWFTFSRPNAFDVDEDFIKPAQKLVEETNSNIGKAQLEGDNLNSDILVELTRSAASTGSDAAAWVKKEETEKPIKKHLKRKNPVLIYEEEVEEDSKKKNLMDRIRELYHKIRSGAEN